jgi:peptidyl-prolyl cis-trans isomerase SurA
VNKIKKIILILSVVLLNTEILNAKIVDSIYLTVGNKPVTQSDIVNEIKLILILKNEQFNEQAKNNLQKSAIKQIVTRKIKEIELDRNNFFQFNDEDLNAELKRMANNINVDVKTLKNTFKNNDLDFSILENQIKVELFWNSLIFNLYKNRISINQDEIEEKLKIIQNKNNNIIIKEYLVSEIVIKRPEIGEVDAVIQKLQNRIKNEGFENVAKNISLSKSASNGGDLGWLREEMIAKEVKAIIDETAVGDLSKPIILPNGILLFKLRNKRSFKKKIDLEKSKNRLVSSEKEKILNMYSLSHYDKLRRTVAIKLFNE